MLKLKSPNIKSKKTASIIILIIIIATGGWLVLDSKNKDYNGEKVYAEAAGRKIYKNDVRALIGKHKEISEHEAAVVLADKYLAEALAKEQGITVSDKELTKQYGKSALKQKTTFKYAYQNKLNQVYFAKLQAHSNGIYKGKMLVANFSRHIQTFPSLPEDKMKDPQLGNPAAIAKDKKYAKDFISDLYNKITSGQINFDQGIQLEHNDPKLGLRTYPSLSHSGSFDTTQAPSGVLNVPSILEKINSIMAGDTTKPFPVRVGISWTDKSKTAESYFLVIKMDETSGSYTGQDFGQYLNQAKQRLAYKINV
jgi:hypothetical protein